MNKIFIVILAVVIIIGGIWFLVGERDIIEEVDVFGTEEAIEVANQWIQNEAPTYVFDGEDLELSNIEEIIQGRRYELIFTFQSRMAGYGDRTDEIMAQVITPHVILILVEDGEVVSAVTDGVYDEIAEEMIETFPETMQIELYFVEAVEGQEQITAVKRSIPYTVATARASLEALLAGLLPHEKAEGLSTSIPEGTKLLNIDIQNGIAIADFSKNLDEVVAGSAWVTTIRTQIEQTLLQFDTVEEVVIMIEGESEDILQP